MARRIARYRPGVINVPSSVGRSAWRECWTLMRRRTSVFGVNETFLRSAKVLYLALALATGWGQYGTRQGPNPLFWRRRRWAFVSGRRVTLHGFGPLHDRWPGYNDARYMTVVVLRDRRDGQEHAFLVTHWVPEFPAHKLDIAWRDRMRERCIRLVSAELRDQVAAGRPAWFMGDTNMGGPIALDVPRFHWVRGLGIDKLGVALPAGIRWYGGESVLVPAPTDHHHGVAALVHLSYRPGP